MAVVLLGCRHHIAAVAAAQGPEFLEQAEKWDGVPLVEWVEQLVPEEIAQQVSVEQFQVALVALEVVVVQEVVELVGAIRLNAVRGWAMERVQEQVGEVVP